MAVAPIIQLLNERAPGLLAYSALVATRMLVFKARFLCEPVLPTV
jgi:hypothetical protein